MRQNNENCSNGKEFTVITLIPCFPSNFADNLLCEFASALEVEEENTQTDSISQNVSLLFAVVGNYFN